MRIPVPNVINKNILDAKEILKEYKIDVKEVDDNSFLNDVVSNYEVDEAREMVTLFVSKRNKSISLDKKISYVTNLGFVTGRNSKNADLFNKRSIGSTDLGIAIDSKDKMLFLYGDSFSGTDCNKGMWNSNFVASSKNVDFANNIIFDDIACYPNGVVKPMIQGQHDKNDELNLDYRNNKEVTKIPTGGIRLGDDIYVFYMSVRYWGKPGEWFVTKNELLKAKYYELNNFKKVKDFRFDNIKNEQFGQIYPFFNKDDENHIYFLAIPGGRFSNTALLRVKKEDFENIEKYEVLLKNKTFELIKTAKREDYFFIVNKNNSSEQSIVYNSYLKKWVISNLNEKGICFLLSDNLFDEFKEEVLVLDFESFPLLYGGFINERMTDNDGKRMYMQVSQWSPIYNTSLFEIVFK
mgnify:FL=1